MGTIKMNERDLDVLNILFEVGEPLTSSDIVNEKRELTQSTVIAVIRKLMAEGLIEVTGATYSGRVLARTYIPTTKAKEAVKNWYLEQWDKTKAILSANELAELIKKWKEPCNE